jgi:hypothetical protein
VRKAEQRGAGDFVGSWKKKRDREREKRKERGSVRYNKKLFKNFLPVARSHLLLLFLHKALYHKIHLHARISHWSSTIFLMRVRSPHVDLSNPFRAKQRDCPQTIIIEKLERNTSLQFFEIGALILNI